jgi:4-hydroxyphenylacetate 3-monooxygenase
MRPEEIVAGKGRPFTGEEYLESLRDGREVWIYGERVKDVTTHPAFRNSARSIARLYDALHDPKTKDVLTGPTDGPEGGYTHRYFRVARSGADLAAQRAAIAQWARLSYGMMGRSPDYKASLMNTLGANSAFYEKWADNAKAWYRRSQDAVLYLNHTLVNPPVDRSKPAESVKDVFIRITRETDAGIVVSGAKVVATNSALTHYNFLGQNMSALANDESMAVMFIAPMDVPGVKLFCRPSYELMAAAVGTPFDYPLSSRFDENDAIFVFEDVLVPWENVLVHRDIKKIAAFYPQSGFFNGLTFHGCTRLAVKLDFLAGLMAKALKANGSDDLRGVQIQLGEVIAWRNMFWAIGDSMVGNPAPWVDGAVLTNAQSGHAYRVLAPDAYAHIRQIILKVVSSGLIYLPSGARDLKNPESDRVLARYLRGSDGMTHRERMKLMKLLWDAVGTEFGGRHELYERNYAGNHEDIRIQSLLNARASGSLDAMMALADQCMSEYDEDGWRIDGLHNGEDVSIFGRGPLE